MKIRNVALLTLDGEPLKENNNPMGQPDANAPILTLARVIEAACMAPARPGQPPLSAEDNVERLILAIQCHMAKVGDEIEIETAVAARIKAEAAALPPLVAAQVALLLEGKALPMAKPALVGA